MYHQAVLQRINNLLARLRGEIRIIDSYGDFSISIQAENVILNMLNIVYGWNLQNVNLEQKHYPAIDLRDEQKKIAVQVTSTGTMDKIIHTLRHWKKYGIDKNYEHLYFYFLKDIDNKVSLDNPRIARELSGFDASDIQFLDNSKIYKDLCELHDLGRLIQIQDLLEEQYTNQLVTNNIAVPIPFSINTDHPYLFYGREKEIMRVLDSVGKEKVIVVTGERGIGKTEFCREILARCINRNIPCTSVNLLESRTFIDMMRSIAGQYGLAVNSDDTADQIEWKIIGKLRGILYIDNFENIISDKHAAAVDKLRTLEFLKKCRMSDLTVLISSRYKLVADFTVEELELDILEEDAALRLFSFLWTGKDSLPDDSEIKNFVIKDLNCYPLSIVLAAKQKASVSSIRDLRETWRTQWESISAVKMENYRHRSLEATLHIIYENIQKQDNERTLWALFTLFPDKVEKVWAEILIDGYDKAVTKLVSIGIVRIDGEKLSVQPTLREFITETNEYLSDIKALAQKLLDYFTDIYGKYGVRDRGTEKESFAVKHLPNALFFMNWLIEEQFVDAVGIIHCCIREYYEDLPYEAVQIVEKAVEINIDDVHERADLLKYCGCLEMRTDKLEEAEGHYREAERLYQRLYDSKNLAIVLKAMGDLEMRTDRLTEAESYYRDAEELYRRIQNDLGLASVLQVIGDLAVRTNQLLEAESDYRDAEELYRRIQDDLGLANVLKAMGDLEMRSGQLTEAESHYREAEALYRHIQDDLGLANVLQALGNLEMRSGQLTESESHYREAEVLYRRIQDDLGFANVLKATGDLEMRSGRLTEAESHYREAESLYRHIQDDLGLANVLQVMGDLEMRTGQLLEAESHYQEAEVLYRRIQDDLGLANVLKAMGDLEMRTNRLSEAESHYQEAKDIYRRIHDDIGLANVLKAMGDLEMRTDQLLEAESHYQKAETLYRQIQDDVGLAIVMQSMGDLKMRTGHPVEAEAHYHEAKSIYKHISQSTEIVSQSHVIINGYFESLKDQAPINECKVVFLGDGGAGKSLIIDRLMHDGEKSPDFDGESTPGICISSKKYPIGNDEIELHFWDFGGQAIMHSMHRLFLTNRTLYVVVTNARDNKANEQAWYWIRNIKSFANGAPVFLIVNQKDQNPSANVNENGLRSEYPLLKGVRIVSALRDTKEEFLSEVSDGICNIVAEMETVHTPFSRPWLSLMNDLQEMPKDYITSTEFYMKCRNKGVGTETKLLDEMIGWFQDLGVCFYSSKHPASKQYMVLKPRWLLNSLYILVFNGREYSVNGIIRETDIHELICKKVSQENIKKVWPEIEYEPNDIQYIINVLLNFSLIFRLDHEHFFIPMLCDENEPMNMTSFESEDAVHICFEYQYLPENVLHRLMVRHGYELNTDVVWRTGAVFERRKCGWCSLVRIRGSRLDVFAKTDNQDEHPINSYLDMIRESIYEINEEFGLQADEYIAYRRGDMEDRFKYKTLIGSRKTDISCIYSEVFDQKINIEEILGIVSSPKDRQLEAVIEQMLSGLTSMSQRCVDLFGMDEEMLTREFQQVIESALNAKYDIQISREYTMGRAKKKIGETDLYFFRQSGGIKEELYVFENKAIRNFKKQYKQLIGYLNPHFSAGITLSINKNMGWEDAFDDICRQLEELRSAGGEFAPLFIDRKTGMNGTRYVKTEHVVPETGYSMPLYHLVLQLSDESRQRMARKAR